MEAKQVKDLMEAYASVYSQQPEQEVISEDLQKTVEKGLDAAAKNPVIKAIGKVIAPVGKGRGTVTKAEQESRIKGNVKEESDLFDVILEYLVAEGYADTNQAALAIMANMSEEWKQSIVEAHPSDLESPDYKDSKRIMNQQGSGDKKPLYKGGKPGIDKITGLPIKGV